MGMNRKLKSTIKCYLSIILQKSVKQDVSHMHWYDITIDFIFISSQSKRNKSLGVHLKFFFVCQPLKFVGFGWGWTESEVNHQMLPFYHIIKVGQIRCPRAYTDTTSQKTSSLYLPTVKEIRVGSSH